MAQGFDALKTRLIQYLAGGFDHIRDHHAENPAQSLVPAAIAVNRRIGRIHLGVSRPNQGQRLNVFFGAVLMGMAVQVSRGARVVIAPHMVVIVMVVVMPVAVIMWHWTTAFLQTRRPGW